MITGCIGQAKSFLVGYPRGPESPTSRTQHCFVELAESDSAFGVSVRLAHLLAHLAYLSPLVVPK
jgi:hypothetical protein